MVTANSEYDHFPMKMKIHMAASYSECDLNRFHVELYAVHLNMLTDLTFMSV